MENDDNPTPASNPAASAPNDSGNPPATHEQRLNHAAIEKIRLEERTKHREQIDSLKKKVEDLTKLASAASTKPSTEPAEITPELEQKFVSKFEPILLDMAEKVKAAQQEAAEAKRQVAESEGKLRREKVIAEEMARTGGQLIPEMITATDEATLAQQVAQSHAAWKRHFGSIATAAPNSSGPQPRTPKPAPPPAVAPADTNAPTLDVQTVSTLKNVRHMSDEEYAKHRASLQALVKDAFRRGANPVLRP